MSADLGPARDELTLITGGPEAAAALRRLKAHPAVAPALTKQGMSPDSYLGRLVTAAAGTPDPLLQTYAADGAFYGRVLQAFEADSALAALEGNRLASLLPTATPITAKLVLVPFFGAAGFADVVTFREGDTLYVVADLPRLAGDIRATPPPKEVVLKVLRAAAAEAWRVLFEAHVKKPPAWPAEKGADIDALLSRTVAEGPVTVFLFPDEFFPIDSLLEEPIARSFARWNRSAEALIAAKKKEKELSEILETTTRGEFWNRSAAIVGAEMTDALVRHAGREAYLKALTAGPRAVAALYLDLQKLKKLPLLTKELRKALDAKKE